MIEFATAFVDKINKNTSFYGKFMETTATKEKSAFRVFNELLVAIQYIKGGKSGQPVISELEQRIKPIQDREKIEQPVLSELTQRIKPIQERDKSSYQTPIFAEEDTILSDLKRLLAASKSNPKPATIQKITLYLKNDREIRKTFMHLKQFYVDELINDAQSNAQWLIEENFLYLVMWKFYQQTLNHANHPD